MKTKKVNSIFCVTRQHYWADGRHIVEIAQGGLDYTNADMLQPHYSGEGIEYKCLSDAVEAGIKIALAWKKDEPDEVIEIGIGNTHGMGLDIEGEEVTGENDEELFVKLRQEAKDFDDKLPKCARCGEIREESYGNDETRHFGGDEAHPFCSEFCAEEDYSDRQKEWLKEKKEEGYEAARLEQGEDACPYNKDSDEGEAWMDGYTDFCADYFDFHMSVPQNKAKAVAVLLLDANVMFEYRPSFAAHAECVNECRPGNEAVFLVRKKDAATLQQAVQGV